MFHAIRYHLRRLTLRRGSAASVRPGGDGAAPRLWKRGLGAVAVVALVVVGVLALAFKAHEFLFDSPYFEIAHVEIVGVGTEIAERARAKIESAEGPRNLLEASPACIRALLTALPEIERVEVRRRLPDTLHVELRERFPVAILVGERNILLDGSRVAMGVLSGPDFLVSHLPLITAEEPPPIELGAEVEDPRIARALRAIAEIRLRSPELAIRVSETHVAGNGHLTLHLRHGTEVRLGDRSLSSVLPLLEAFHRETDGMKNIEYAEFQYRNQIAFRRRGEVSARNLTAANLPRDPRSLPINRKGD